MCERIILMSDMVIGGGRGLSLLSDVIRRRSLPVCSFQVYKSCCLLTLQQLGRNFRCLCRKDSTSDVDSLRQFFSNVTCDVSDFLSYRLLPSLTVFLFVLLTHLFIVFVGSSVVMNHWSQCCHFTHLRVWPLCLHSAAKQTLLTRKESLFVFYRLNVSVNQFLCLWLVYRIVEAHLMSVLVVLRWFYVILNFNFQALLVQVLSQQWSFIINTFHSKVSTF